MARSALFERGHVGMNGVRRQALRRFGANVGLGGTIKRGVRITFPWKLELGRNTWLGEDAWLLNLAPIRIGSNVCISQRAFLCTGNHDWSDPSFRLLTAPITIEDGAWIGAASFVGPGVTVGTHTVVSAGSVVTSSLPPYMICAGNPCQPLRPRRINRPGRGATSA
jgi:putative colanic acid biosynthesis acetyltransferase WcaF